MLLIHATDRKVICKECNSEFETNKKVQRFCSRDCKEKARAKRRKSDLSEKKCVYCGKMFKPARQRSKFCSTKSSDSCAYLDELERRRNKPLPKKPCAQCKKMFQPRYKNSIHCSIKGPGNCRSAAQVDKYKPSEEERKIPLLPPKLHTCPDCNETFPNTDDYYDSYGIGKGRGRRDVNGNTHLSAACSDCVKKRGKEKRRKHKEAAIPCPCDCGCSYNVHFGKKTCWHCFIMQKNYGECREGYNFSPDDPHWFYIKVSKELQLMKGGRGNDSRLEDLKTKGFVVVFKVLLTRKATDDLEKKVFDLWGGKSPEGIEKFSGFSETRELDYELLEAAIDMIEEDHTDRICDIIEP